MAKRNFIDQYNQEINGQLVAELHLKIKDVTGMDEEGRHVIIVDKDEIVRMFKTMKKSCILADILLDKEIRQQIFLQESARHYKDSVKQKKERNSSIRRHIALHLS